ncbi:MAG: GNAT family N-acetyltransferase [Acutalibacteraceae bacterium]|nr:GNAT family N-acetyltransferase [Acutalibacteraceae bacterium]
MITVLKTKENEYFDLEQCAKRNFKNECWNAQQFEGACNKGSLVLTARDANTDSVIGFGVMDIADNEGYIGLIAVDEEYRCQGVGRAIVWRLLQAAEVVFLDVRKSNENAIKFYKTLGFEIVADRKDVYSNPTENMITMKIESDKMTTACQHCKGE